MMTYKEFISEGINDPGIFKVVFVAGGAGSGKSFVAEKSGLRALGLRPLNSDDALEAFIKKEKKSMKLNELSPEEMKEINDIRTRAKKTTKNKLNLLTHGKIGVFVDSTAKEYDKIKRQKSQFESLGYDAYMIFVNTSLDIAKKRNSERARTVPDKILEKTWNEAQNNIGKFQNLFGGKNFIIVDNDNAGEKIFTSVFKRMKKFISIPVTNHIATKWMELERKIRSKK